MRRTSAQDRKYRARFWRALIAFYAVPIAVALLILLTREVLSWG